MQPLKINNGLCVVCNSKRYMPYSSTCQKCYDTTDYQTRMKLFRDATKKANEDLKKERNNKVSNNKNIRSVKSTRQFKVISNCVVHIVVATSRLEALEKGRDWFGKTQVRVMPVT